MKDKAEFPIGITVGNYTIKRVCGQGFHGIVCEAIHVETNRRAAIKILRTDTVDDYFGESKHVICRRFSEEAKALSLCKHENIVDIYDAGSLPDGTAFIMMEYLEGTSLRDFLATSGGTLPLDLVRDLVGQIADALVMIHANGIVHRDLTPRNIFIVQNQHGTDKFRVKILDFGIAKFINRDVTITRTQGQLGTIRYMAPEQCEAAATVDESADIYALGLIMFELLTGKSPYTVSENDPLKWIDAHINRKPNSLRSVLSRAPFELDMLIKSMLDKHPEFRPSAAGTLASLAALGPKFRRGYNFYNRLVYGFARLERLAISRYFLLVFLLASLMSFPFLSLVVDFDVKVLSRRTGIAIWFVILLICVLSLFYLLHSLHCVIQETIKSIIKKPRQSAVMSRVRIRQIMEKVLLTDSDLDAFCIDHFYNIKMAYISNGMNRKDKMSVIIEHIETRCILTALVESFPSHSELQNFSSTYSSSM